MVWMNDQFSARTCDGIGQVDVRVSDDFAFFFDNEVAVILVAAVAKVENNVLGNRRDAVLLGSRSDEVDDALLLTRV